MSSLYRKSLCFLCIGIRCITPGTINYLRHNNDKAAQRGRKSPKFRFLGLLGVNMLETVFFRDYGQTSPFKNGLKLIPAMRI